MEQSVEEVIEGFRKFLPRVGPQHRWNLVPRSSHSEIYADAAIAATLTNLGRSSSPKEFLDELGLHDFPEGQMGPIYEAYMKSFRGDLAECLSPEQLKLRDVGLRGTVRYHKA